MKNSRLANRAFVWAFFALLAAAWGCSQTQSQAGGSAQQPSIQSAETPSPQQSSQQNISGAGVASVIVVHGKIVSVDREKKQVTLQGPDGKNVTLRVYNPYNLASAKPGDPFVAKFYEIATIQKLASGQTPPEPSLTRGIVSAGPGQTPGTAFGQQLQFSVTIDSIDKPDKAISVKGPDGVVEVVDVANPETLDTVQVGEHIVVTLTDAVVISIDKESTATFPQDLESVGQLAITGHTVS